MKTSNTTLSEKYFGSGVKLHFHADRAAYMLSIIQMEHVSTCHAKNRTSRDRPQIKLDDDVLEPRDSGPRITASVKAPLHGN